MEDFTLDYEWFERYEVDVFAIMELLDEKGISYEMSEDGTLTFSAMDENHDGIPDFVADLINPPVGTNPSHGVIVNP